MTLQTLDADYFEPGREYLLWFRHKTHTPEPAVLKLTLRFMSACQGVSPWDRATVETALHIETAPVAARAAYFDSRGARILLDPGLYQPEDATSQMDNFLFTRRRTNFIKGGLYITVEISYPPCHVSPPLADIIRKHGQPDCELTARLRNATRGDDKRDDYEYDCYYYDHFIFEIDPADAERRVRRVSSQYFNTAAARPPATSGATWTETSLAGREFRLFFQECREVARFLRWEQPEASIVSGTVPAGVYLRAYDSGEPMEKLTHDGAGEWAYESYHRPRLPPRPLPRWPAGGGLERFFRKRDRPCLDPLQKRPATRKPSAVDRGRPPVA